MPATLKKNTLKKIPSCVQLPGGIVLKGVVFKAIEYNKDGSAKTFELQPAGATFVEGKELWVMFVEEAQIRGPAPNRRR